MSTIYWLTTESKNSGPQTKIFETATEFRNRLKELMGEEWERMKSCNTTGIFDGDLEELKALISSPDSMVAWNIYCEKFKPDHDYYWTGCHVLGQDAPKAEELLHGMQVVVTGNPLDGIEIHGPFAHGEEASTWAEREHGGDWWLARLQEPTAA